MGALSAFAVFPDYVTVILILEEIWILTFNCRVVSEYRCPVNKVWSKKKQQKAKHCGINVYAKSTSAAYFKSPKTSMHFKIAECIWLPVNWDCTSHRAMTSVTWNCILPSTRTMNWDTACVFHHINRMSHQSQSMWPPLIPNAFFFFIMKHVAVVAKRQFCFFSSSYLCYSCFRVRCADITRFGINSNSASTVMCCCDVFKHLPPVTQKWRCRPSLKRTIRFNDSNNSF